MLHRKDDMELLFQLRARATEGGGAGGGGRVRLSLDQVFGGSFGAGLFASDFVPSAYTVSCSLGAPMRVSMGTLHAQIEKCKRFKNGYPTRTNREV